MVSACLTKDSEVDSKHKTVVVLIGIVQLILQPVFLLGLVLSVLHGRSLLYKALREENQQRLAAQNQGDSDLLLGAGKTTSGGDIQTTAGQETKSSGIYRLNDNEEGT